MIYLYVKTHIVTNLKYFGKTTREDYETYRGSGKYWKRHIRKHGYHVRTELVFYSDCVECVEAYALKFSRENNIVESDEWANMINENGRDGGSLPEYHTEESKSKMSMNRRGKVGIPAGWKHTEETKEYMSKRAKERCDRLGAPGGAFKKGNIPTNKGQPLSEEQKKKLSYSLKRQSKITCKHCGESFNAGNYSRWHGDNCRKKNND